MKKIIFFMLTINFIVILASENTSLIKNKNTLTLKDIIAEALSNNSKLAYDANVVMEKKAQKDIAKSALLPNLSLQSGYSFFLDGQRFDPAEKNGSKGVFSHNIFSNDLILRIPIFNGGSSTAQKKAAEFMLESSKKSFKRSKEELIFKVTSVFYTVLYQKKILESLNFSHSVLEKSIQFIEEKIKAEKAVENDKLKVKLVLLEIEQQIQNESNILAIQKRILFNYMGRDNGSEKFFFTTDLIQEKIVIPKKENFEKYSIFSRYDYKDLRLKLKAQEEIIKSQKAKYWPTISAFVSYGIGISAFPYDNPENESIVQDKGVAGIFLEFPIFDGYSISSKVKKEQAKMHQIQNQLRNLELTIRLEIEKSYRTLVSYFSNISIAKKAVMLSKKNLLYEQEKYKEEKASLPDILDAQSFLLKAQVAYYTSIAKFKILEAEFQFTKGGTK